MAEGTSNLNGGQFMIEPLVIVGLTILGVILLKGLFLAALARGDLGRIRQATRASWRTLTDRGFAEKVGLLLNPPPPPPPPPPPKPDGSPLRLLNLLQREGRFLDFLMEDIEPYDNALVGANVKELHKKCRKAVEEHLVLEPVLPGQEESLVEVPTGFDPWAIRLTGNVTGKPPFQGTLKHPGWRVKEIKLAKPAEGQDEFVVQPAEVELT